MNNKQNIDSVCKGTKNKHIFCFFVKNMAKKPIRKFNFEQVSQKMEDIFYLCRLKLKKARKRKGIENWKLKHWLKKP